MLASQNGVDQDNKKDEAVPQGIASPFYPLIKKGVKMNKKETDGFSIKVTSSTKRADDPPIYTDDKVVPKFRIIDNKDKTRRNQCQIEKPSEENKKDVRRMNT